MRDAREHQAGSKERFAKRIIAAIAAVAMLGGVGYATATTAGGGSRHLGDGVVYGYHRWKLMDPSQ